MKIKIFFLTGQELSNPTFFFRRIVPQIIVAHPALNKYRFRHNKQIFESIPVRAALGRLQLVLKRFIHKINLNTCAQAIQGQDLASLQIRPSASR